MIKAQIYTKCLNDDVTSILVAKGNQVYFQDVIDTPELTGIQRGVSFVKNHLEVDVTEIYPDEKQKEIYRLNHEDLMKDAYINYCKVNHRIGENPNEKALTQCQNNLSAHLRWNFTRGGRE